MVLSVMKTKGSTLLELLISLLILLVVSLALVQSAQLGMSKNLENSLRDEAVNVADMRMNQLMGLPFTDAALVATPAAGVTEEVISRYIRLSPITYTPTRTITDINADSKQIAIAVEWKYKGKSFTHGSMSIMRIQ